MTAPLSSGPSVSFLSRFDAAQGAVVALLTEVLASTSAGEFLEALGLEALERHLPPELRLQLLQQVLLAGRAGRPFDDAALLGALPPELLVAHLPALTLRDALARLPASLADAADDPSREPSVIVGVPTVLDAPTMVDSSMLPPAPLPGESDLEALDEDDEMTVALDDEGTQALLGQLPPEEAG